MRIISGFKDYYDGGAIYGVDKSIQYVRKKECYNENAIHNSIYRIRAPIIIGFCGEIYFCEQWKGLENDRWDVSNRYIKFNYKKHTLYNDEQLKYELKFIKGKLIKVERYKYQQQRFGRYCSFSDGRKYTNEMAFNELSKLFFDYKTPIFKIHIESGSKELVINPSLKELNFATIHNTNQAFQKISQYLTNELAHSLQNEVPVGNDEVIGTSKGFDRYSFRNAKKKPKKF